MNREMANSQFAVTMGAKVDRLEAENQQLKALVLTLREQLNQLLVEKVDEYNAKLKADPEKQSWVEKARQS